MARPYVPERGDLVWLRGGARAGHRPALILSPAGYNRRVGLALCCPVASQPRGYPFEVALPARLGIEGVILSDQIKSLDWRARRAKRIGRLAPELLQETVAKILALVDPEGEAS